MSDDELFLTAILQCNRSELLTQPLSLTGEQQERFNTMRSRRKLGEPVQYICGFTEFMGYRMDVGPGVLVPRPETEVLVDRVIQTLREDGVKEGLFLDIGTGSGCIPVTLLREIQGSKAVALDVSPEAIFYARRNAELNNVAGRIDFVSRDMFWFMDEVKVLFDLVISNPPYIPRGMISRLPEDVKKEPQLALDGGPDGLCFYRFIIPAALRVMKPRGLLALEFGDGQRKELENLFVITGGWDKIEVIKDNAGKDRALIARKKNINNI